MAKKTVLNKNTRLETIRFSDDNERIITLNSSIELVFEQKYHFNIVRLIFEEMKKSTDGEVSQESVDLILKKADLNGDKGEKRYKNFDSFYKNAWVKGFSKEHNNNQYVKVRVNGKLVGSKDGKDKKFKKVDADRRLFLERVFDHAGMQSFWINPKTYIKHYWIYQYQKRWQEELGDTEAIKKERFIELNVTEKKEQSSQEALIGKNAEPILFPELLKKIENSPQLILLGEGGSGKSTTLKHYLKQLVDKLDPKDSNLKIPVLIELKRFKEEPVKDILSFVISSINHQLDNKITDKFIDINSDCILLFDGLDEITDLNLRSIAISQLKDLLPKIKNVVMISCRSRDYQNDFYKYHCYELKEFTNKQIQKYLSGFFKENKAEEIFKTKIEIDPKILTMARNPFLLYIIARTLKEDPDMPLPKNKGALIEKFVEQICSEKNKELIGLPFVPKHIKHRLLGMFAYYMLDKEIKGEIICSSETRIKVEDEWLEKPRLEPSKILLLAEKERFLKSGSTEKELEFIHPLIQDYFAAYYIKNTPYRDGHDIKEKVESLLEYKKWDSIISILVGIVSDDESEQLMELLANVDPYFSSECFLIAKKVSDQTECKLIDFFISSLKNGVRFNIPIYKDNIIKIHSTKMLEELTDFIWNTDSVDVKSEYLHLLVRSDFQESIEMLINSLKEKEKTRKIIDDTQAIIALSECKELGMQNKVVDAIIEILNTPQIDSFVVNMGIYSLGKIGNAKAVNYLIKLIEKQKDVKLLFPAIISLGIKRPQKASAHLKILLSKNKRDNVRYFGTQISFLHMLFKTTIEDVLRELEDMFMEFVEDKDWGVQWDAISLLNKMRSRKAIPTLVRLLPSSPSKYDSASSHSIDALGDIGILTEEVEDKLVSLLKKKVKSDREKQLVWRVAITLKKLESREASNLVNETIYQIMRSTSVNEEYYFYLVRIKFQELPDDITQSLLKILKESKKDTERGTAWQILKNFLPDKVLDLLVQQLKSSDIRYPLLLILQTIPYCSDKKLEKIIHTLKDICSGNKSSWKELYTYEAMELIKDKIGRRFLS